MLPQTLLKCEIIFAPLCVSLPLLEIFYNQDTHTPSMLPTPTNQISTTQSKVYLYPSL